VSRDLSDLVVADLARHVAHLDQLPMALPRTDDGEAFRH
jgi:hypothetical protein